MAKTKRKAEAEVQIDVDNKPFRMFTTKETGVPRTVFDNRLCCGALRLGYDFQHRVGRIRLPDGDCTDASGCIQLFQQIDPDVERIATYSGTRLDTVYKRKGGEWLSIPPVDFADIPPFLSGDPPETEHD